MKKLPDLKQLSDEAKDALIVELWQEIQKLRSALKPDSSPAKTSSNSSTPPSCMIQAEHQALAIENTRSQKTCTASAEQEGEDTYTPNPTKSLSLKSKVVPSVQK